MSEVGILKLRALDKPKIPENWRTCFTDPVPLCEKFRDEANPICRICLRDFAPYIEPPEISVQSSGRLTV